MQTISPQIEVDKEMAAKCRRFRTLQKKVESTQAQIKALRAEIEAEFGENGEEIYYRGILLATFKIVISTRFDSKKFQEDYPEFWERYTKTSVSRRFLLK